MFRLGKYVLKKFIFKWEKPKTRKEKSVVVKYLLKSLLMCDKKENKKFIGVVRGWQRLTWKAWLVKSSDRGKLKQQKNLDKVQILAKLRNWIDTSCNRPRLSTRSIKIFLWSRGICYVFQDKHLFWLHSFTQVICKRLTWSFWLTHKYAFQTSERYLSRDKAVAMIQMSLAFQLFFPFLELSTPT